LLIAILYTLTEMEVNIAYFKSYYPYILTNIQSVSASTALYKCYY